jgi:3-(3-hydroxy-phenyl)propionate hydroxylase/6-hydroxy-3-succinoylpyridine 3-monooxygenase
MSQHIIIAGGGPTGLLAALGLARAGAKVTVLEAAFSPNTSPRALVYHFPVLPHLEKLGILDDCTRIGFLKQDYGWRLPRTGETIRWSLSCLDGVVERPFNLHLGQDKLSEIVGQHLTKLSNAVLVHGMRVTAMRQDAGSVHVVATAQDGSTREYAGDWLVAADGGSSTLRSQILRLNFFGITWPERFIATNIQYDFEKYGYARTTMQVDDELGAVIVKIDDKQLWRVTYMEDASLPAESVEQRIPQALQRLLPGQEGYELVAYSPYKMHQRTSDSMRVGRVMLVGDAGHVTNPTGGLGLTSGMFDAFALVEALSRVINDGTDDEILTRYSDDRRRRFIELASPRASQNKLTVFHSGPGKATDAWIERTRAIAQSPERMRDALSFTRQLESRL